MKKIFILTALAFLATGCTRQELKTKNGTPSLRIDWSDEHQTIVGFGGTMGWIHPHPEQRERIFDLLFNELGVSVLRIRALGSEQHDEHCLEPVNDNNDPNVFGWSNFHFAETEARNAATIKDAAERGVNVTVATSWSPPGWMKTTGSRSGGGSMQPDEIDEFAELWAAYIIGMKREFGIDIKRISIQNEPDITMFSYPTCRFEPETYAAAVKAVEERFRRENLDVQVLGPDTCRIYHVPDYVDEMKKAETAAGTPILTHLYDLSIDYGDTTEDAKRWRTARKYAEKQGRPLWLMETANYLSYDTEPASYEEAFAWAKKIHYALTEGNCEVVCWWALFFDKRSESLIYTPESDSREIEITPKFHTSMNYYRFVRPGMIRTTAVTNDEDLLASAFTSEDGTQTIVIINRASVEKNLNANLSPENWLRYETTADKPCLLTSWKDEPLRLPARSVTTFVSKPDGE